MRATPSCITGGWIRASSCSASRSRTPIWRRRFGRCWIRTQCSGAADGRRAGDGTRAEALRTRAHGGARRFLTQTRAGVFPQPMRWWRLRAVSGFPRDHALSPIAVTGRVCLRALVLATLTLVLLTLASPPPGAARRRHRYPGVAGAGPAERVRHQHPPGWVLQWFRGQLQRYRCGDPRHPLYRPCETAARLLPEQQAVAHRAACRRGNRRTFLVCDRRDAPLRVFRNNSH